MISYTVIGEYVDGPPGLRSALINYEAELEFTADTHFHGDHKPGERLPLYGEIEYVNEGDGWRVLSVAVISR